MKKIILSLVTVVAVAAMVAGATQAVFSNTSSITGNTFSTATISIDAAGEANAATLAKPLAATNLVPGQWSNWARGRVLNNSTVDVKLYMYVANLSGVCDKTVLKVTTGFAGSDTNERARVVFNDWISALVDPGNRVEVTGNPPFVLLPIGWSQVVQQQAQLHPTADNSYQYTTCTWDEVFVAENAAP